MATQSNTLFEDSLRKCNRKSDDGLWAYSVGPTVSGFCATVRSVAADVEEDRGGQVRGVPTEPALRILENEAISGTWPE